MSPFNEPFGFSAFSIIPFIIYAGFAVIFVIIIIIVIKGISTWNSNNKQPRLTVPAVITSKRIDVSRSSHMNNASGTPQFNDYSSTFYYITFQFESGDRMEFKINGNEYGLLSEGDKGNLSFQGTRYLGFSRDIK